MIYSVAVNAHTQNVCYINAYSLAKCWRINYTFEPAAAHDLIELYACETLLNYRANVRL